MYPVSQNSTREPGYNLYLNNSVSDEGQHFTDYLTGLGLLEESGMLVLSLRHHYYFDYNDLKDLRVLVILRKLDQIKHIDNLLQIIFRILPSEACFIGCFAEKKFGSIEDLTYHHYSAFYNKVVNMIESKAHLHLHKSIFPGIIESHGFSITDMTPIKGDIYFTCQNKRILS